MEKTTIPSILMAVALVGTRKSLLCSVWLLLFCPTVFQNEYLFFCGDSGDFVLLTSVCDGVVDCSNAMDEKNSFCPGRINLCLNGGTCVAGGACVCASGWTGVLCETGQLTLEREVKYVDP